MDGHKIKYVSPEGSTLLSENEVLKSNTDAYDITLTHYYAQQRTLLYVNSQLIGELKERMVPRLFVMGDKEESRSRKYQEISFWRSAMTPEEITLHHQGICMKSSLEIYTPLDDEMKEMGLDNRAQTLNNSMQYVAKANEEPDKP